MNRIPRKRTAASAAMSLLVLAALPTGAPGQATVTEQAPADQARLAKRSELLKETRTLRQSGRYQEVRPRRRRPWWSWHRSLFGPNDVRRAESLKELSQALASKGADTLVEAIARGEEGLEIRRKAHRDSDRDYAVDLGDLAILYGYTRQINPAIDRLEMAAKVLLKSAGENDSDYARALVNIAKFRWDRGDPQKKDFLEARNLYKTALPIMVKAGLAETADYADMLMNFGLLRHSENEFDLAGDHLSEARGYYVRALRRTKAGDAELHDLQYGLAVASQNLGYHFLEIGHFHRAIPLFREAIDVLSKMSGTGETEGYAAAVINLALLHMNLGNLTAAEAVGLEGVSLAQTLRNENRAYYVKATHNLGRMLQYSRSSRPRESI